MIVDAGGLGEVRWANLCSDGEWLVGFCFTPPIPPEFLQSCAECGVLERRGSPRLAVRLSGIAKWELTEVTEPVRVSNYSAGGGFCLVSRGQQKPGDRVLIEPSGGHDSEVVRGAVRWQSRSDDGVAVGCEFLSPEDASVFSRWINARLSPRRGRAPAPVACPRRRRQWMLALGNAAIVGVACCSAGWQPPRTVGTCHRALHRPRLNGH